MKISAATSFPDIDTANKAITETTTKNEHVISKWMTSKPKQETFIRIYAKLDKVIGYGIDANNQTKKNLHTVAAVLTIMNDKIKIVTAYPII
jgi:CDI toxin RNase A-like protein